MAVMMMQMGSPALLMPLYIYTPPSSTPRGQSSRKHKRDPKKTPKAKATPVTPAKPTRPLTLQEWARDYGAGATVSRIPGEYTQSDGDTAAKRSDEYWPRNSLRYYMTTFWLETQYRGCPSPCPIIINRFMRGETTKTVSVEEWTDSMFRWRVTAVHQIPGWERPAEVTFYGSSLPRFLVHGTPWSRTVEKPKWDHVTMEGDHWTRREEWCSWRKRRWAEKVLILLRNDDDSLLRAGRDLLRPSQITHLVIDQRLSKTEYKETTRFGDGIYGNDLFKRSLQTWEHKTPPQELVDFIKPLYPTV